MSIDLVDVAERIRADDPDGRPLAVGALAFHPDGRRLAVGLWRFVLVCDLDSGARRELRFEFPPPVPRDGGSMAESLPTDVEWLEYSRDGRALLARCYGAVSNNEGFRVVNVFAPDEAGPAPRAVLPPRLDFESFDGGDGFSASALSPDGRWVVGATESLELRLYPVSGGEARTLDDPRVVEACEQGITALAFAPDSKRVAIAYWKGLLELEVASGRVTSDVPTPDGQALGTPLAYARDGALIGVSRGSGGRAWLVRFDGATATRLEIGPGLPGGARPVWVAEGARSTLWTPGPGALPARGAGGVDRLVRLDPATGRVRPIARRTRAGARPHCVAVSADGTRVARSYGTRIVLSRLARPAPVAAVARLPWATDDRPV